MIVHNGYIISQKSNNSWFMIHFVLSSYLNFSPFFQVIGLITSEPVVTERVQWACCLSCILRSKSGLFLNVYIYNCKNSIYVTAMLVIYLIDFKIIFIARVDLFSTRKWKAVSANCYLPLFGPSLRFSLNYSC